MELLRRFNTDPSEGLMDTIVQKFFMPLAQGALRQFYFPSDIERDIIEHECVVQCWMKFDKFNAARANALAYFTRVVRNYAMDKLRSRQRFASRHVRDEIEMEP